LNRIKGSGYKLPAKGFSVPPDTVFNIEHEREGNNEEIEFWKSLPYLLILLLTFDTKVNAAIFKS